MPPNEDVGLPPVSLRAASPPERLAAAVQPLLGMPLTLTGKPRTDGAALRHAVTDALIRAGLPPAAPAGTYEIVPRDEKGVPRILREVVDTYLVTSGSAYNLQIWNRFPARADPLVRYATGEVIRSCDVRLALARHDAGARRLAGIVLLSPAHIERHFGVFGRPTVKEQLIISARARDQVLRQPNSMLFYADDAGTPVAAAAPHVSDCVIQQPCEPGSVVPLTKLREIVRAKILGMDVPRADTKTRGQFLERQVLRALGYPEACALEGGYPDLPHQALEVKVQDSPTIDLGKYSPHIPIAVPGCPGFTTESVRYLIALCDEPTSRVVGAILMPGRRLGEHFTFVAASNFKCQRSIPMAYFDRYRDRVTWDPEP